MAISCVPVWWKTTTVARYDIPYDDIETLHFKSKSLSIEQGSLMPLSDNYDILVSLILPDIYADWNIESSSTLISKWISQMSHIANFSLSSQIIYHPGEIDILGKPHDLSGFVWSNSDLSNVINSIESHLQSNQNPNSKMVQLVAYVPPQKLAPLFFNNDLKRALLPDWGCFGIVDVDYENLSDKMLLVDEIMEGFVTDLKVLFGADSEKERASKNIQAATNSLDSLSKLLQRVRNMVINEDVSLKIKESVQAIENALQSLADSDVKSALSHSRVAYTKSESAFFDVSLLELLYFPQDQKFAIYVPLFLPVGLPILMGAVAAFKFFKQQKVNV